MMKRRCCRSHDKHVVYLIGSAALNEAPAFRFSAAPRGAPTGDSYALPVAARPRSSRPGAVRAFRFVRVLHYKHYS